jgi:hypothetical protein
MDRIGDEMGRGHGGVRPGSGPKPKALSTLRRNRIMLNLTDDEYRTLRKAAGRKRPAGFAREVLLRFLARQRD